jgi:hypothetical protein
LFPGVNVDPAMQLHGDVMSVQSGACVVVPVPVVVVEPYVSLKLHAQFPVSPVTGTVHGPAVQRFVTTLIIVPSWAIIRIHWQVEQAGESVVVLVLVSGVAVVVDEQIGIDPPQGCGEMSAALALTHCVCNTSPS